MILRTNSAMMSLCGLMFLLGLAGASQISSSSSGISIRFLEDVANGDNYNGDLSQYTVTQGHCFRMKIVGDNDDDGNSYFYNGAYRAQYKRYVSYSMCTSDGGSKTTCNQYVAEIDDYLEQTVEYVQSWCSACSASCRRRSLRELEGDDDQADAEAEAALEMTVNCNRCSSDCKLLNTNKGRSGTDESGYLACQVADNTDEEGSDITYYTAPQCENDHIVIGHFYDQDCSIKTNTLSDTDFSYNTFQTLEKMNLDCSVGTYACTNLYKKSVFCEEGAAGDQQDANLCKAASAAGRVYTYYKKPFYKKVPITLIFFMIFGMGFGFGFLSYTYYVRHRRSKVIPMANLDQHGDVRLPEVS